ncbi:mitochondrial complex I protein Fmp36 [Sarocladium strictum]
MARTMALPAYRHLLRAARIAFQGDAPTLAAAQGQIRNEFRQKASLPLDDPSVSEAVEHAEAVASILRSNVVQGKQMEGKDHMYKLNIHEHTERGDNDSILTAGTAGSALGGGCCGGSGKK